MKNPGRKHFFNSTDDYQVEASWRWEEQVVSRLLTVFGLTKAKWPMLKAQEEATGVKRLTMLDFYCRFPDFPVFLVASSIYKVDQNVTVQKLFQRFEKTQLYREFENAADLMPEEFADKPFGVVVRWPYLKNGLVVHDAAVDVVADGMRMLYHKNRRCIVIESFDNLLSGLPPIDFDYEREA